MRGKRVELVGFELGTIRWSDPYGDRQPPALTFMNTLMSPTRLFISVSGTVDTQHFSIYEGRLLGLDEEAAMKELLERARVQLVNRVKHAAGRP